MACETVLISVYIKKYGLWNCKFRIRAEINNLDFNKPEKIEEKLSTLRDIFCPCPESFIHIYYYSTKDKEQLTHLSIMGHDTKYEISRSFNNRKALLSKQTLVPLEFENVNTITIKIL